MKNFIYHSPAKIVFGENQINKLGDLLKENNVRKMLLVYGRESIKKLGIYENIIQTAKELDIELYEESGVLPNPDISSVRNGVKTCKENNVDFDEMWSFSDEIHKFLGNRPKMFPGFIGGHCVIPNLELIEYDKLDIIREINEKFEKNKYIKAQTS